MAANKTLSWSCPQDWSDWLSWLKAGLHGRNRRLLPVVMAALVLANGRRTVTSWLRAAGLAARYQHYYYFVGSVGLRVSQVRMRVLQLFCRELPLGERVVLALDDSPTRRYGPCVEGAGLHRNPTSGPDDHKFIYGHIWITVALVLEHAERFMTALPIGSELYIKAKDQEKLTKADRKRHPFKTKLELALKLLVPLIACLKAADKVVWIVFDGGYAYRPLIVPLLKHGVTIVSRLRRDAGLLSVPTKAEQERRGAKRKYGKKKISLSKRAAHRKGWQTCECFLYGTLRTVTYKTFEATYPVVGGSIRVVLVKEKGRWDAFFATKVDATVAEILTVYASRSSIEQLFSDVKHVWGAGEQQVRKLATNIGAWHLTLWAQALTEMWSWNRPARELAPRTQSPWDTRDRRPSSADKRKALRLQMINEHISRSHRPHADNQKFAQLTNALVQLAA